MGGLVLMRKMVLSIAVTLFICIIIPSASFAMDLLDYMKTQYPNEDMYVDDAGDMNIVALNEGYDASSLVFTYGNNNYGLYISKDSEYYNGVRKVFLYLCENWDFDHIGYVGQSQSENQIILSYGYSDSKCLSTNDFIEGVQNIWVEIDPLQYVSEHIESLLYATEDVPDGCMTLIENPDCSALFFTSGNTSYMAKADKDTADYNNIRNIYMHLLKNYDYLSGFYVDATDTAHEKEIMYGLFEGSCNTKEEFIASIEDYWEERYQQ